MQEGACVSSCDEAIMKVIQFDKSAIGRANRKLDVVRTGAEIPELKRTKRMTLGELITSIETFLTEFDKNGTFQTPWPPAVTVRANHAITATWKFSTETPLKNEYEFKFSDPLMSIASLSSTCVTLVSNKREQEDIYNFTLTDLNTGLQVLQTNLGYADIPLWDGPEDKINTLSQSDILATYLRTLFVARKTIDEYVNSLSSPITILKP